MKKLFYIIPLLIVFITACSSEPTKNTEVAKTEITKTEKTDVQKQESMKIEVEEYLADPEQYIGKELLLTGTVVHVCKHDGKKLFIIGKDPEKRVKFTTGKDMPSFDIKWEGSKIEISGIVKEQRVNEAMLDDMEKKVKESPEPEHKEEEEHGKHEHEEGTDHHHSSKEDQLKNIQKLREKIQKSEKGYISFFSLECSKYKLLDQ